MTDDKNNIDKQYECNAFRVLTLGAISLKYAGVTSNRSLGSIIDN